MTTLEDIRKQIRRAQQQCTKQGVSAEAQQSFALKRTNGHFGKAQSANDRCDAIRERLMDLRYT